VQVLEEVMDHQFQIPLQTKVAFFNQHVLEYLPVLGGCANEMGIKASPPALAMFLQLGGKLSIKLLKRCRDFTRPEIDDYSSYDYNYNHPDWDWIGIDANDSAGWKLMQRDTNANCHSIALPSASPWKPCNAMWEASATM
jgi:hypothetical protein